MVGDRGKLGWLEDPAAPGRMTSSFLGLTLPVPPPNPGQHTVTWPSLQLWTVRAGVTSEEPFDGLSVRGNLGKVVLATDKTHRRTTGEASKGWKACPC